MIMRNKGFIFCLLVIALTSCDPSSIIDFKLVNNSGHAVTITSNLSHKDFWPNDISIESGQDTLIFSAMDLGPAPASLNQLTIGLGKINCDTVICTFDDGKRLVYTQEEGNGPFDFNGKHYNWTTKKGFMFLIPFNRYGHLSYTITEEDYANSVEP